MLHIIKIDFINVAYIKNVLKIYKKTINFVFNCVGRL